MQFINFIRARLREKSTLHSIAAGIAAAAVAPSPFNYALAAICFVGAFLVDGPILGE